MRGHGLENVIQAWRLVPITNEVRVFLALVVIETQSFEEAGVFDNQLDRLWGAFRITNGVVEQFVGGAAAVDGDEPHARTET